MIRQLVLGFALWIPVASSAQSSPTTNDVDMYVAVLSFFKPPRNQVRWIEPTVPLALRDSLLQRLDDRFEAWSPAKSNDPRSGGRIRLMAIDRITLDSVRVRTQYQHRTQYHENKPFDLSFVVVRRNATWMLRAL